MGGGGGDADGGVALVFGPGVDREGHAGRIPEVEGKLGPAHQNVESARRFGSATERGLHRSCEVEAEDRSIEVEADPGREGGGGNQILQRCRIARGPAVNPVVEEMDVVVGPQGPAEGQGADLADPGQVDRTAEKAEEGTAEDERPLFPLTTCCEDFKVVDIVLAAVRVAELKGALVDRTVRSYQQTLFPEDCPRVELDVVQRVHHHLHRSMDRDAPVPREPRKLQIASRPRIPAMIYPASIGKTGKFAEQSGSREGNKPVGRNGCVAERIKVDDPVRYVLRPDPWTCRRQEQQGEE